MLSAMMASLSEVSETILKEKKKSVKIIVIPTQFN